MLLDRKFLPAAVRPADNGLGDRQIRVIASDSGFDRSSDVVMASGCDFSSYMTNPIVLANHDRTKAIGTARVTIVGSQVTALITFAPLGASATADEYCALAKAGVLNAVSIGFKPIKTEPIYGQGQGSGVVGYRYLQWELCEISVVAVPANPRAVVIERSMSKSGRAISALNADKLREAHDAAETARSIVARMLDDCANDDDEIAREALHLRMRQMEMLSLRHAPLDDPAAARRIREVEMLSLQENNTAARQAARRRAAFHVRAAQDDSPSQAERCADHRKREFAGRLYGGR